MIDTTKRVRFYDDRGRNDTYFMKNVIFEDVTFCLCYASFMQESHFGEEKVAIDVFEENSGIEDLVVLFYKDGGDVLCTDLAYYYAENF